MNTDPFFQKHEKLIQTSALISGTAYGGLEHPQLTFSKNVKLRAGINKLALLSISVGLQVSSLPLLK